METVTQAIALEANPQGDEDLAASIRKWRLAARSAADTLFGIAGDKVNQLGGPGGDAWRTMMGGGKKSFGWDEEEPKRPGTDDEGDGDEGIGGEDEREEESKKSDEEWGMELMLKTFGIPLKMLGWDKEGDCWKPMEEMEEELA
jgi:Swi5-dependent recombination DNA repair protein 1